MTDNLELSETAFGWLVVRSDQLWLSCLFLLVSLAYFVLYYRYRNGVFPTVDVSSLCPTNRSAVATQILPRGKTPLDNVNTSDSSMHSKCKLDLGAQNFLDRIYVLLSGPGEVKYGDPSSFNQKELQRQWNLRTATYCYGCDKGHLQLLEGSGRPLGTVPWSGAVAMCRYLANSPDNIPQAASVLELGAGTGLVGIALQTFHEGGYAVEVTDVLHLYPLMHLNVELNNLNRFITAGNFPWMTLYEWCDLVNNWRNALETSSPSDNANLKRCAKQLKLSKFLAYALALDASTGKEAFLSLKYLDSNVNVDYDSKVLRRTLQILLDDNDIPRPAESSVASSISEYYPDVVLCADLLYVSPESFERLLFTMLRLSGGVSNDDVMVKDVTGKRQSYAAWVAKQQPAVLSHQEDAVDDEKSLSSCWNSESKHEHPVAHIPPGVHLVTLQDAIERTLSQSGERKSSTVGDNARTAFLISGARRHGSDHVFLKRLSYWFHLDPISVPHSDPKTSLNACFCSCHLRNRIDKSIVRKNICNACGHGAGENLSKETKMKSESHSACPYEAKLKDPLTTYLYRLTRKVQRGIEQL